MSQELEALIVPQVRVGEDGSLMLDEESLKVKVQGAKEPNPALSREVIFKHGSTTTYSSFRKKTCSKCWCSEETEMFFLAINMLGMDFSLIASLFPHRNRTQIRNKFMLEDQQNSWRINQAFRERRMLDVEYFSKRLQKIMEVQKNLEGEEGGGKASKPRKQQIGKMAEDASYKEPREKRSKMDEPGTSGDTEAALLPLSQKVPPPSTKAKDSGEESMTDETSDQVNEDASPSNEDNSSEDDEAPVVFPRPTRRRRVPKPTRRFPCEGHGHWSECTAKRGRSWVPQCDQESKKARLVTLTASQPDYSDEKNGQQWEREQSPARSPSTGSAAPAFVPASLRCPPAEMSKLEETMEELDVLANMPDVLGVSQDALCPDASVEHNETCDHQLDLLDDVEVLYPEHTEVTEDESYNEAAQSLLTVGTQAHAAGATSSRQLQDSQILLLLDIKPQFWVPV